MALGPIFPQGDTPAAPTAFDEDDFLDDASEFGELEVTEEEYGIHALKRLMRDPAKHAKLLSHLKGKIDFSSLRHSLFFIQNFQS